jgi:hypothetical protein
MYVPSSFFYPGRGREYRKAFLRCSSLCPSVLLLPRPYICDLTFLRGYAPSVPSSLCPSFLYPISRPSIPPPSPVTFAPPSVRFPPIFFVYIYWLARVCWPLLCLCRPFCFFERCLYSHPESSLSKQARYQLSHPSPYLIIIYFPSSVLFPFPLLL